MPDLNNNSNLPAQYSFLSGGGETGRLIREKDWSFSVMGTPLSWPQSLRTVLGIVLNSKFPMCLFWGNEFIFFYNDAYIDARSNKAEYTQEPGLPAKNILAGLWDAVEPLAEKVLLTGEPLWRKDLLLPVFKNEDIYLTCCYTPVNDETEKPGGVLCTFSAIAENIKTENIKPLNDYAVAGNPHVVQNGDKNFNTLLSESEKKFRNTVMQAAIGITVLRGPSFIAETANQAYLDIIGKTDNEFVGRSLFVSLPEIRETVEPILMEVLTKGTSFNTTEFAIPINRFGKTETGYFNFSYHALRENDDTVYGVIATVTEVTDLVKAKHALAESEKSFRTMIMQSPIPMTIFRGPEFIIEIANTEMFKRMWRREEAEVTGKKLLEVFPELKDQPYPEQLKKVYATGETYRDTESLAYVQGNDGMKKFYLDYEYAPLFETDGSISGIMVTVNDVTEKVEARQRVEIEEARLRLATEGTNLATWDLDLQNRNIVHSARLAEIFGHASTVIISHEALRQQIHPDDLHTVVEKAFEEAIKTSIYFYEARVVWPDETIHWIRTQGKVIYNKDKEPQRMIGTLQDITDTKINEREVARLAAIVQSSADAIISKKLDGTITSWNTAAEKMFGYSADEIIGRPITVLIPPALMQEEADILSQIAKGMGVYAFETRRLKKDKTVIDISLTISPIKDARGNIIGASKIARDITRQKEIEKQITDSEEKFRLLANSMAQQIWTSDARGNLNYFNQAVYDYAGLTFEDIKSGSWLQIVHPDDRAENISRWKHSVETGEDFIIEHRFRRHDGEYRWQLSRALAQRGRNGDIQMWVGTSTDINEIKENEQQKDFFISMASHELKTPITTTKGYVQILMNMYKDKGDEFLKKSLETINKQITTLTTLIAELLDLSKIKAGSLQLNKEHFYVTELIEEIISETEHTEPGFVISFTENTNAKVYADKGRIGQVLINLFTNAIKYSPGSKQIAVSSRVSGNEISVAVADSGIGISKADQQKIFQRFYRVAGKDEKTFPGFGIGLFIAAEIIERHNGAIGVNSEPGKGSVFYFSLPLNNQ
jgi:PAS domain S-box-containing protein